ncbi:MAG TPA: hypothetical protein VNA20_18480 [Frankiaceae bacterium]|nr:hypothetical protein [Frankiaceae bacterium]
MGFWQWLRKAEVVPPPVPPAPEPGPQEADPLAFGSISRAAANGAPEDVARVVAAFAAAPPGAWLALDREFWDPLGRPLATTAEEGRRAEAAAVVAAGRAPVGVVRCALAADGYVREAALGRLGELPETLALPLLALRCADPVHEVRAAARRLAEALLAGEPSRPVPVLAPVAYALRERRHGDWLADRVDELVRTDAAVRDAALANPHARARRAAYRVAVAAGVLPVDRLLAVARADADPSVRRLAGTAAVERAGDPSVLRPLLGSANAALRAAAVWALASAGDVRPAADALADRAASVRSVAQVAVRRAGGDPAATYRRMVSSAPTAAAVAGLGETGEPADAALVRPFLRDPVTRTRVAAVRALRRLGGADPGELLPLLSDPRPAVARAAAVALRDAAFDLAPVRRLLGRGHPEHVRWAAFRLLRTRGTVERLLGDLTLLGDPEDPLAAAAYGDLRTWLAQDAATAYAAPAGDTAAALARALRLAEPALAAGDVRRLRFHLGLPVTR